VDAIPLYQEARRLYETAGEEVESARTLIGAIDALGIVGRSQDALETARWCMEVFERHGETLHLAKVQLNIGNMYHRLDNNSAAGQNYWSARAGFVRAGEKQLVALADTNLGNVATNLCHFQAARTYYRRAAAALEGSGHLDACRRHRGVGALTRGEEARDDPRDGREDRRGSADRRAAG
jgi:tetratricopeptide (TPR) repeat protein